MKLRSMNEDFAYVYEEDGKDIEVKVKRITENLYAVQTNTPISAGQWHQRLSIANEETLAKQYLERHLPIMTGYVL